MNPKFKKIIIFFLVVFCLFLNSLQNAAANEKIILKGQVALEGRTGITDANPTFLQVRIKISEEDKAIFRDDYVATYQIEENNDNIYFFEIDLGGKIEPGNYDISVKEWHYLDTVKSVSLSSGENNIDFGEIKAGDINNNDRIDIDGATFTGEDLDIFYAFYDKEVGSISLPPYPLTGQPVAWHADINNDGVVNVSDENFLWSNNPQDMGLGAVELWITYPIGAGTTGYPVWMEGETRTLKWRTAPENTFLKTVKLQYSINEREYTDLTTGIPNTGEYALNVQSNIVGSNIKIVATAPEDSFYYVPSVTSFAQLAVLPKRTASSYPTASNVLVVYNNTISNNPNFASKTEGLEIAQYYSSKRDGVNLLGISIPDNIRVGAYGEEISRDNYEKYIRNSIKDWLDANSNKDIRYIVLTKGVPLKIKRTSGSISNEASVDSELSFIYSDYNKIYDSETATALENPYYYYKFDNDNLFKDDGFKYLFQPNYFYNYYVYNTNAELKVNYLVTRLDGYTVADVKAMIDRAVVSGHGDYYWILDDGGKGEPYSYDRMMGRNPYLVLNNKWAKTVLEEDLGLANYVVYEDLKQMIYSNPKDPQGPVIAYVGHGVYDGCPNNCITDLFNFNLAPGALYSSYESFNAYGFHDNGQSTHTQLGEWIAIGGTGGVGNVYEPYANTISNEAIWMPAYAAGYPLADAFYMSLPQLSWTQVVIGDPLTSIRALPNQVPIITNLTITPASGQAPLNISFASQAQDPDPDGSITNYLWNFGDGGTSADQNPNHIYNNPGIYTAILTVTDNSGATTTRNITIIVTSPPEMPPADTTPPLSPSEFRASADDSQIVLSWINPRDSDFIKVRILRKEDNYSTSINDGRIVYEGNQTSYIDAGLINNKIYYYAIFASDNALNWSSAKFIQATLEAKIIPEPPITQEEKINSLKDQINLLIERILVLQTELKRLSGITYEKIPVGFRFSKYLKRSSKNDEVKYLQIILKIEADGIFGLETNNALKEFQKSHELVADGIIGPKTRAELNNIF